MAPLSRWKSRLSGFPIIEVGSVLLLLMLSWQVVTVKRVNATLRGEIERSTRSFVAGDSMPPLPVKLADGSRIEVPALCGGRPLLLVISSPRCRNCRRIRPDWRALAGRNDLSVVVIETGPGARASQPAGNLVQAMAEGSAIIEALRIREVPAAVLSGPDCRIRAAGAGLAASRSVLALAGESVRLPATVSTSSR